MPVESRLSRRKFLKGAAIAGGSAAFAVLLEACGLDQDKMERNVWAPQHATAQANSAEWDALMAKLEQQMQQKLKKLPAEVAKWLKGLDRPLSPPPSFTPVDPTNSKEYDQDTPARVHVRHEVNQILNRHSETEDVSNGINNEIDSWIGHFVQSWQDNGQTLKSGDVDVIEAALPFVWNHNTRSQMIHVMGDQRQKGTWEGHPPVPDALVDYAYSCAANRWGFDLNAFKTQPDYEQTRNVTIETAARARDARKKMYDLNLFANLDQAVPSLGTLIPLSIWETGGYQDIGSNGPARDYSYNGEQLTHYVDYIVTVARENTGVKIPLSIEGSSAGALGPQIMPPAFTAAINYVKEHAPNARLNPFDMTDGMIFASIFLQQNMYDAQNESRGKFWYYSNNDPHDDMISVMGHWNPEINQMNYLTNSFYDYKNRFGSATASMNRRQAVAAAVRWFATS